MPPRSRSRSRPVWRRTSPGLWVLEDNGTFRYVEQLRHRTVAWRTIHPQEQAGVGSGFRCSTVRCFWHEHYASPEDARQAAINYISHRGILTREPEGTGPYRLRPGLTREPDPEEERGPW